MNNNIDISIFEARYKAIISRFEGPYDPIYKAELLGGLIKEILEAYGTNEVLLATPSNENCEKKPMTRQEKELALKEWIDAIKNGEDCSDDECELWEERIDEITDKFNRGEFIEWVSPQWIEDHPKGAIIQEISYHINPYAEETTIVRIGIVDGETKLTWQQTMADRHEDLWDRDSCVNFAESDWLKFGNIAHLGFDFLHNLIKMLLSCPEIWEYTFKYPQLHKLKE